MAEKICPIRMVAAMDDPACITHDCAWYDADRCALAKISGRLGEIKRYLPSDAEVV